MSLGYTTKCSLKKKIKEQLLLSDLSCRKTLQVPQQPSVPHMQGPADLASSQAPRRRFDPRLPLL
jgi:hypothetical protein